MSTSRVVPPPPMPSPKPDIDGAWRYLEWGLNRIMLDGTSGFDRATYMTLYMHIYNVCHTSKTRPSTQLTDRRRMPQSEELYHRLDDYLKTHLASVHAGILAYDNAALLDVYTQEWKRYTAAATFNSHLFRCLDLSWVKWQIDEGNKAVFEISTLHLVRWKDQMLSTARNVVLDAMHHLAEKQRHGETAEPSQINDVIDSFVSLGVEDADSIRRPLESYRE